jgi:hypothetical protein
VKTKSHLLIPLRHDTIHVPLGMTETDFNYLIYVLGTYKSALVKLRRKRPAKKEAGK